MKEVFFIILQFTFGAGYWKYPENMDVQLYKGRHEAIQALRSCDASINLCYAFSFHCDFKKKQCRAVQWTKQWSLSEGLRLRGGE